jgi:ABC-type Fe3+ transport system substrate-binding protein
MRTALLAVLALVVTSACGGAGGTGSASPAGAPSGQSGASQTPQASGRDELTPEARRLVQAARDNGETELNLSWGSTSMGGTEAAKRYEALVNEMYGTNIRITLIPGPSMPDMGIKITQEYVAGQKASSDVYLGLETYIAALLPRDVLEPYDYTQLSPRLTRDIVADPSVGVEVYGSIPTLLYNSDLVRRNEVPSRLEGVLDPKWKGKISASVTASYFEAIALRPEWGTEKMKTFVGRLAEQAGGLMRQSEEHRIVSGEFQMFVLGNTHGTKEMQARGAPVDSRVPEDVAQYYTMHLSVPRNSAHPNLAKLYIAAVASEAGQRILWETYFSDHPQLPGSQAAAELNELRSRGIDIQKVDVKFAVAHPELPDIARELQTILREKGGR